MDPLSVQMVMGSPPMLRGAASLSNLVGRKKKSPNSDKGFSLKTPSRLTKVDEDLPYTPSRCDTVRARRGFRPLSVITNSMLTQFEAETLKAMDEVKVDEDDNVAREPAKAASGRHSRLIARSGSDYIIAASEDLTSQPSSNESEISLQAFLAQTSPPAEHPTDVVAPFSTLYQIPAPDLSQHPIFSADPFTSRSDAPSLVTTSSLNEIKKFAAQTKNISSRFTHRTSASSDVFSSSEKKPFKFFEQSDRRSSPRNYTSPTSTELSPLAKRQPKSRPIQIKNTPDIQKICVEKTRATSGGLRKISNIFRSKIGSDKGHPRTTDPVNKSPSSTLKQMEDYLRKITCSPTYHYTGNSWLPRHPNTGRFWRSRNLKCTNCLDAPCACCGITCCAYRSAVIALENHKDNPDGRQRAVDNIQKITMVYPYGREMPTFLQCTSGVGNGAGCGKLVCPECCGACPDEACGDIQCRKCKENPWGECDWHASLTSFSTSADAVSIRHTV